MDWPICPPRIAVAQAAIAVAVGSDIGCTHPGRFMGSGPGDGHHTRRPAQPAAGTRHPLTADHNPEKGGRGANYKA
ncbi:MAG: hypothetical protein AMJ54_01800 [Deltaproteobacteria bacterium SG8_13]|nr:MAG: hypothetical protein AMJ54_01800 [Deltaproteobacteria bacterium SG8_13]